MFAGIYQIKCTENNKVYVGRAYDISSRWKEHLSQLEGGTHSCKPLLEDYQKYGVTKFEFSILELTDLRGEELNEELDVLEARNGVKQRATDSSTGYNFISRYRYEKRDVGSIAMLNKNRIWICDNLNAQCLAIYSCLLAYYDYGKHLVITKTGLVEKETGLSRDKVVACYKQLEKANLICETELLPYCNQLKVFAISKEERVNLESIKYAEGALGNIELDIEVIKQIKESYNTRSADDAEEKQRIISKFHSSIVEIMSKNNELQTEYDALRKKFAQQNRKISNPLPTKDRVKTDRIKKLFDFNKMPENYAMYCDNEGQTALFNLFVCEYYKELREEENNPATQSLQSRKIIGQNYTCIGHGKVDKEKEWYGDIYNCYQYWCPYRCVSKREFEEEDNSAFTVFNFSDYDWEEYINNSFLREVE